jgi:hypothetical protein
MWSFYSSNKRFKIGIRSNGVTALVIVTVALAAMPVPALLIPATV